LKVRHVEHWTEHFELKRPYTIAYETIGAVDNEIVRIETDSGLIGVGAASPGPEVTGESIDDCHRALMGNLVDLVMGRDVRQAMSILRDLEAAMAAAPGAHAAVDMALYDLAAQDAGLPLTDILGRAHDVLPTSITIGITSIGESLDEANDFLNQGFRILKIKLGHSLEEDLERLHKLRETLGHEIRIRVDINQGYSPGQYERFFQKTQPLNLEFIEQPLNAADVDGMRGMPEQMRLAAAADESLLSPVDALDFTCPPKPFGIYNIKLMKCGGIFPALRIADIAGTAGIDLMWGCNDESIVSITAALHAALASPATKYLDLDGSLDLGRDIVRGGFVLENGELRVIDKPGLGVTLL